MDFEERRAAGLAEVARAQREREIAFRPRCSDCRFGPLDGSEGKCEHFVHWHISPERRLSIPVSTKQARSANGLCGPKALLFAPYGPARRLARRARKYDPATIFLFAVIISGMLITAFT
jgi:hypothetical protein